MPATTVVELDAIRRRARRAYAAALASVAVLTLVAGGALGVLGLTHVGRSGVAPSAVAHTDGLFALVLCVAGLAALALAGVAHRVLRPLGGVLDRQLHAFGLLHSQLLEREADMQLALDALALVDAERHDPEGAASFVAEAERLVASLPQADAAVRARELHTLRGLCDAAGLEHFVALLRRAERACDADGGAEETVAAIAGRWHAILRRSGVGARARGPRIELTPAEHRAFVAQLRRRHPHAVLEATVASWLLPTTAAPLRRLVQQARGVAARRGTDLAVQCRGGHLRLTRADLDPLWSALVHVVRNAAVHAFPEGHEPTTRRTLDIIATHDGETLLLQLRDNGVGIDAEMLAAEARLLGHDPVGLEIDELICLDGVSTRSVDDTFGGRGVGMSAVRDAVAQIGGVMSVGSVPGLGTVFSFEIPDAVLTDCERAAA